MNWSLRRFALLGAVTLTIGFAIGAAFVVSAHDGSLSEQDICATSVSAATAEAPFPSENDTAMKKMMNGMAIEPTGDVDADFVAMMAPHHQGAIEMAVARARFRRHAEIRRLGQVCIVCPPAAVPAPVVINVLGVSRLGDPLPASFSPLYKGQLLVHGMGFSPDHHTIAVVAIGSNAVNFIDTATNSVKHITYVGRSPHEAFFTIDGKEVWGTVRGENYVAVLDGTTYEEKARIVVAKGPGRTCSAPDGKYGDG